MSNLVEASLHFFGDTQRCASLWHADLLPVSGCTGIVPLARQRACRAALSATFARREPQARMQQDTALKERKPRLSITAAFDPFDFISDGSTNMKMVMQMSRHYTTSV
jgi:hypothetical protein